MRKQKRNKEIRMKGKGKYQKKERMMIRGERNDWKHIAYSNGQRCENDQVKQMRNERSVS